MDAKTNAPIIIKRKKIVVAGGHHGGAWKVAYADFVTAMMAFFLLMWLLSSASEQQRSGIADYFSPTIPMHKVSGGGDGMFGGDNLFTQDSLAQSGTGGAAEAAGDAIAASFTTEQAAENASLEDLEAALLGMGGETMLSDNEMRHIVTRLTDEGLIIEIFDVEGASLFVGDTDEPRPVTLDIMNMISRVLAMVENDVAIAGHVQTKSFLRVDYPVWDLSTNRAARVRLMLEDAGFEPERVARQTGLADRMPSTSDPQALRNNRIEMIVLRSDR